MSSLFDPTPLELVADDAGIGPDALRDYLRAEIERVRRPNQSGETVLGLEGP